MPGWLVIPSIPSGTLRLGGVEMEEKGERYRDGDKVCYHIDNWVELMIGIEVLR